MIAGGESYYSLIHKPRTSECKVSSCSDDLVYDPEGGLRLFPYGALDTHFSQRGRSGRLIRLAVHSDIDLAFGVDETTGLYVKEYDDRTEFEVFGKYGVNLFNMKETVLSNGDDFKIKNVKWSYFTVGDKITLHADGSLSCEIAPYKYEIEETKASPLTSTDVFSSPDRPEGRDNYMEFVILG
eukprot:CAMPEP_0170543784 /NCGR_PEP_ID=MMETSP0211-20121228/2779_1 /TAXON_ID=311385 /ORGANISM="Pseudokeronopsis sp., Strain OXSARD2" /LENGTH=182 /DNA_ID=CAMNT_0010847249 /DNA_START=911 /DNA_END=1459 /DNA_ORIENTATION=+